MNISRYAHSGFPVVAEHKSTAPLDNKKVLAMIPTDRFDHALSYASRLHRFQRRKGTTIPYVAHLLAVAALVIEHGGNENQAIAALLHDAAEDQGGEPSCARSRRSSVPPLPRSSTTAPMPGPSRSRAGGPAKRLIS